MTANVNMDSLQQIISNRCSTSDSTHLPCIPRLTKCHTCSLLHVIQCYTCWESPSPNLLNNPAGLCQVWSLFSSDWVLNLFKSPNDSVLNLFSMPSTQKSTVRYPQCHTWSNTTEQWLNLLNTYIQCHTCSKSLTKQCHICSYIPNDPVSDSSNRSSQWPNGTPVRHPRWPSDTPVHYSKHDPVSR